MEATPENSKMLGGSAPRWTELNPGRARQRARRRHAALLFAALATAAALAALVGSARPRRAAPAQHAAPAAGGTMGEKRLGKLRIAVVGSSHAQHAGLALSAALPSSRYDLSPFVTDAATAWKNVSWCGGQLRGAGGVARPVAEAPTALSRLQSAGASPPSRSLSPTLPCSLRLCVPRPTSSARRGRPVAAVRRDPLPNLEVLAGGGRVQAARRAPLHRRLRLARLLLGWLPRGKRRRRAPSVIFESRPLSTAWAPRPLRSPISPRAPSPRVLSARPTSRARRSTGWATTTARTCARWRSG